LAEIEDDLSDAEVKEILDNLKAQVPSVRKKLKRLREIRGNQDDSNLSH